MPRPPFYRACHQDYIGKVCELTTSVKISNPFSDNGKSPIVEFTAIWDTGATNTAITPKVIDALGLKPIGVADVETTSGRGLSNTYFISISLPNQIEFPHLQVTRAEVTGSDVLIGMDIITEGDFAVTNKVGNSSWSFRKPSIDCINFVKQNESSTGTP